MFFIPLLIGLATGGIVALSVKSVTDVGEKIVAQEHKNDASNSSTVALSQQAPASNSSTTEDDVKINMAPGPGGFKLITDESTMVQRIGRVARESLNTLIMLPIQILLTSLSSIIIALLYLKTRQAGGENLRDLFSQFEETEHPRKKWQERVRNRLIQSGRITSRS